MKRLPSLFIALLACFCLAVSCAKKDNGKTFTVGFDPDFPPYGYKSAQTGEYIGFDLELAAEVAKRNGWQLVKQPINWNAKDAELDSGAIDCIWNGFSINGRENQYTWTEPYANSSQIVLVKKDSPIVKLSDLAGKVVAVQTDTPIQKALSPNGERAELGKSFKELVVSPNYNSALMELESGVVDAVAMDIGVAKHRIHLTPDKFTILQEIVMTEKYGVGFKRGNDALRDQVQKTLRKMIKDGTATEISKHWFDGENMIIMAP